mmetsp:Transcript_38256/g.81661  ORF Transcript_38256/g.81661 Transcript_38256/m.81661 type:complete len:264 (+) Transcript_38256:216-1007(+)|eukprot:CAMPEP_0172540634 /NCGR_PEP_ID=MMETSP1067-20121228/11607_1 /TAXON_ID=265564 ORGANISM="Thalassiosira punctigera, Strain Tpunct2005C2" /NCGR_SAMPLE_ID=MMETSP1067 /ASSEMBLY_ACC=CAM_ASM_000444 /LENGTH=263 /DNA_ID=CAMNT_0013326529 /DNA_START=184 /DNA_END=975 /DNA_ORIENTATION=-
MQPKTSAEKELLKENLYVNKLQNILRKHKGSLQAAYNPSPDDLKDADDHSLINIKQQYATESAIIERVMASERSAFLSGIALSGLVFASVRYGPRYLAVKINPAKKQLLKEADEIAKKANTRWIQKTVSFLFEASFGAWAGWRGYNMVSSQNKSSYEEIARVPLCAGRSSVSDNVCPDMINLVHKEIPPAFWKNLDDGEECRLKDPLRWRSARDFATNCVKRNVFEESYRQKNGLSPGTKVNIPEDGVPDNILLSFSEKTPRV